MRINKYIAQATGMSRRSADEAIKVGLVTINGQPASLGSEVNKDDKVFLNNKAIKPDDQKITIMLNKPAGYVSSRRGQGSKTIYDLLPKKYHKLKPVGRLDKDTSGLLLITNDGELANKLTHPKYQKQKVYTVKLDKTLEQVDKNKLLTGVELEDGLGKFLKLKDYSNNTYEVTLTEGRNRQIRRTFNALSYKIIKLHRMEIGKYNLKQHQLISGGYLTIQ